jgi:hypothetical protein
MVITIPYHADDLVILRASDAPRFISLSAERNFYRSRARILRREQVSDAAVRRSA